MNSYANEIDSALNSILSLANTEYQGKYLFGGTDYSAKPFGLNADESGVIITAGDISGKQYINIASQHKEQINLSGTDNDVFNLLISIRDKLQSGTLPDDTDIQKLNDTKSNILDQLSHAGVQINNLDNTSEILSNQKIKLQELISNVNEVDILQASYKMSAMVLPKSLIDFL